MFFKFTYDHRPMDISRPVCSAEIKHRTGGLVVRWVTTSESPLLYVLFLYFTVLFYHISTNVYAKAYNYPVKLLKYEL